MEYTFEILKKQIISLNFSKTNEIKDLNISSLINYVSSEIIKTDEIINEELIKLGNKNIEKFNDLYYLDEPIKLNSLIIISNLHILLLKRIKVDLLNL